MGLPVMGLERECEIACRQDEAALVLVESHRAAGMLAVGGGIVRHQPDQEGLEGNDRTARQVADDVAADSQRDVVDMG